MKIVFGLLLTIVSFRCHAQDGASAEEAAVRKTIENLFSGMRNRDTLLLASAFAPDAILQTIAPGKNGAEVKTQPLAGFIKSVGTPREQVLDERIVFDKILIDGALASVWTPYKFYLGTQFSHCGVNSFQLVKTSAGWKIQYIIDTRRKEPCN